MQVFVALEAEIIIRIFATEDFLVFSQRVLNDLWRTRLSRRRMIWLLAHPLTSPVRKLDRRYTGSLRRETICIRERGEGEGGAKLYDGEKAWSSINHSKLSCLQHYQILGLTAQKNPCKQASFFIQGLPSLVGTFRFIFVIT
jgi:hypothetical protein